MATEVKREISQISNLLEYSAPLVTTTWSISGYKVTGEYGATFEIDKSPTEMAP